MIVNPRTSTATIRKMGSRGEERNLHDGTGLSGPVLFALCGDNRALLNNLVMARHPRTCSSTRVDPTRLRDRNFRQECLVFLHGVQNCQNLDSAEEFLGGLPKQIHQIFKNNQASESSY